ncbi:MarR family winged helix-turn-helix transcriptional regulator [Mycobacterium sp. SMC-4]|uniref:MarR family winged helix-turn-helix transcriptional regulator n=1 Tax=Mycobacterium sp. SMC-4 TaxID=2857059 RepID=UPI003D05119A
MKTSAEELAAFETAVRDLAGMALRSVDKVDVTLPQFRLLSVLAQEGTLSSTECAKALGVVGSSVTRLADRLHASGHLLRCSDPANRSVVRLELTPKGRKVVQQVAADRRRQLRRILDRIDPDERAACAAVLRTLHELYADGQGAASPPVPVPQW